MSSITTSVGPGPLQTPHSSSTPMQVSMSSQMPSLSSDPALPASLSNPLTETPTKTPQIKKCLTTEKPSKNIVEENEQKKLPSLLLPKDRDQAVRLQVFLDQKHFGPGFIDGKPGKFTKLAAKNYNVSLGR